jgi:hypothetical protein
VGDLIADGFVAGEVDGAGLRWRHRRRF